uniref:Uncharacterized protein n=1 Tax=Glossina austeni TaxID=7395 RepID=A0A1A9VXK5_GLOAU
MSFCKLFLFSRVKELVLQPQFFVSDFSSVRLLSGWFSPHFPQRPLKSSPNTFTETLTISLWPYLTFQKCIYILIDNLEQLRTQRQNYNKTEGKQQDSLFLVAIMPSEDDGKAKGHSTCFLLLDSCEVHFPIRNNNTYNNNNKKLKNKENISTKTNFKQCLAICALPDGVCVILNELTALKQPENFNCDPALLHMLLVEP